MEKLRTKTSGIFIFSDYKKTSFKIIYGFMILILIVGMMITVFPPLWLLLSSFKSAEELYQVPFTLFPKSMSWSKVVEVWTQLNFGRYYINSLWLIIGATLASILFNGLLAYAVSVIKPVGYKLAYGLVMVSLMIPAVLNMGTLLQNIVSIGLTGSFIPLWLVYGANPFYFILFKTFFDSLPETLYEAAELDGANKLQIFTKIIIPLSKPIISVISIFTVNAAWSDFLLPYLVLAGNDAKQTVMVKIFMLQSSRGTMNFGDDRMLMVLAFSIIPPVLFFMFFQKQITESVASTGIK